MESSTYRNNNVKKYKTSANDFEAQSDNINSARSKRGAPKATSKFSNDSGTNGNRFEPRAAFKTPSKTSATAPPLRMKSPEEIAAAAIAAYKIPRKSAESVAYKTPMKVVVREGFETPSKCYDTRPNANSSAARTVDMVNGNRLYSVVTLANGHHCVKSSIVRQ